MAEPFAPSDYSGLAAKYSSWQNYAGIGKTNPFGKDLFGSGTPGSDKSLYDIPVPAQPAPVAPPEVPQAASPYGTAPVGSVAPVASSPFSLPTLNLPTTQSLTDAVRKHLGDF